jgi:hypothetical protein
VWNNLGLDDDETNTSFNNPTAASSWQEEAHWMSFRNAVRQFASLKLTQEEDDEDKLSQEEESSPKPLSSPSNSTSSSLASDLAETKMRLALAQAERDELEFALLQRET